MRRVRANIVEVEKQYELYILSVLFSLRYLACNAHAPYFHVWPTLYLIFPHYLINGTILGKKGY